MFASGLPREMVNEDILGGHIHPAGTEASAVDVVPALIGVVDASPKFGCHEIDWRLVAPAKPMIGMADFQRQLEKFSVMLSAREQHARVEVSAGVVVRSFQSRFVGHYLLHLVR